MGLQIIAPTPESDPVAFIDLSDGAAKDSPYLFDCQMNSCENNISCGCIYNSSDDVQ